MRFLSLLIPGARRRHDSAVPEGDTGVLAYDPDLVGQLKQNHRDLVAAVAAIKMASAACRFDVLPGLLRNFKRAFQAHTAAENARLYAYVQRRHRANSATSDFVIGVRGQMHGISRTVVSFADAHSASAPTHDTLKSFRAELDLIGALLLKRVHVAESRLYHLYRPS